MAQTFLTDNDFKAAIKTDHLNAITSNDSSIKDTATRSAQTEIESYLRGKYNLTKLFPIIPDFVLNLPHAHAAIVYDPTGAKFYTATATDGLIVPADTPLTDSQWVEIIDPRDPLIVEFMLDLALYKIHARVAPNQIPETRIQRRDDAIDFLKRVAAYDLTVGWDQDDDTEPASINWGSNEKESKIY